MSAPRRWLSALPYAAMVLAYVAVGPWGDFPLNDDWVYARITHRLADTGKLVIDVGATASVLAQALTVAPLVKLFGHSHLVLRAATMAWGLFGLWLVGRLLALAGVRPKLAVAAQLLVALNPLYFYLATTFMTELHGWVPALLAAWLYFQGRARADAAEPDGPLLAVGRMVLVAAVAGATFWTRQFCAIVFPALLLATLVRVWPRAFRHRAWRSWPAALAGCAVFTAVVLGYFAVGRWTDVAPLRDEFRQPFRQALRVDLASLGLGLTNFLAYATVFFLPLLAGFRWRAHRPAALASLAAALVGVSALGWLGLQRFGTSDMGAPDPLHRVFPFGGNVIFNAGVGPVTLSDVYNLGLERQHWPLEPWKVVGALVVLLTAAWAPAGLRLARLRREATGLQLELACFGLFLGGLSLAAALQAFKWVYFDRYSIPGVLGLALALPLLLEREPVFSKARAWTALLAAAPVAWFTVAGVHDQFRWNEARWALVAAARARGAEPTNIEAGYEVAGWLAVDAFNARRMPAQCVGECRCGWGWFCLDATWHVGMNVLPGYQVLESRRPAYWLARGPPVTLAQRAPAPLLVRSNGHRHWASLGAPPPGFVREQAYRVLEREGPGTRPLYGCDQGVVSLEARCGVEGAEPRAPLAHLLASPAAGARPLYNCRVGKSDDRFISPEPGCEGQGPGELLGHTLP